MKNKILLVEDESDLQTIVSEVLIDEGYEVFCASNGIEGMNMILSISPDLVVADVMMPVMDGFTMAREIRKFQYSHYISHC